MNAQEIPSRGNRAIAGSTPERQVFPEQPRPHALQGRFIYFTLQMGLVAVPRGTKEQELMVREEQADGIGGQPHGLTTHTPEV